MNTQINMGNKVNVGENSNNQHQCQQLAPIVGLRLDDAAMPVARSGCWNRAANTPHSGVLDEEGAKELNKQGRELDITGFHFDAN